MVDPTKTKKPRITGCSIERKKDGWFIGISRKTPPEDYRINWIITCRPKSGHHEVGELSKKPKDPFFMAGRLFPSALHVPLLCIAEMV